MNELVSDSYMVVVVVDTSINDHLLLLNTFVVVVVVVVIQCRVRLPSIGSNARQIIQTRLFKLDYSNWIIQTRLFSHSLRKPVS